MSLKLKKHNNEIDNCIIRKNVINVDKYSKKEREKILQYYFIHINNMRKLNSKNKLKIDKEDKEKNKKNLLKYSTEHKKFESDR